MKKSPSDRIFLMLALAVMMTALPACGSTTSGELEEAAQQPGATTAAIEATPVPTLTSPPPTSTPVAASGEWIVFASTLGDEDDDDTSDTDIYVMRIDGSETRRLTDHPDSDWDPDLSPDGQKVVFVSNRDGKSDIYLVNVDGTDLTRLTEDADNDTNPAWSPGGQQIVFVSSRDDGSEIYTMNADGSGIVRLTDDEFSNSEPAWSPDGQQIAYSSFHKGSGFDIFVMNADGSSVRQVTENPDFNLAPAWSPDSEHIVYSCWYTANIEKDRPFNIFALQNSGAIMLLYGGTDPGLEELVSGIHVIGINGTDMRQLTEDKGSSWSPSWSPDGQQVAFVSDRDGDADIYVINADGSGVAPLTDNGEDDYTPSW